MHKSKECYATYISVYCYKWYLLNAIRCYQIFINVYKCPKSEITIKVWLSVIVCMVPGEQDHILHRIMYHYGKIWPYAQLSLWCSLTWQNMLQIWPQLMMLFRGDKDIYSYFMSILHIDLTVRQEHIINPSLSKTRTYLVYIINIMGADVLATQGARASATIIFTMYNWVNLVPARQGLNYSDILIITYQHRKHNGWP